MIVYYLVRRWSSRPCPRCGRRVKRDSAQCPNCETKLRWQGGDVFLDQ
jgi:RNA polymerase subunit RPABC4/transcription elongation factor Spt4